MKKILIAGDSISMVRPEVGISYTDIYPIQLSHSLFPHLVINGSLRANNSAIIAGDEYQHEFVIPLVPDVVVLQIGIADCAPRVFGPLERRALAVLSALPGMQRLTSRLTRYRADRRLDYTRRKNVSLIDTQAFETNIMRFVDGVKGVNPAVAFVVVNIVCPRGRMVERNYGIAAKVAEYNAILSRIPQTTTVDFFSYTKNNPEMVLDDGYHITKEAHRFLRSEVEDIMSGAQTGVGA
jgi:lysophospholipase L1-like esterase